METDYSLFEDILKKYDPHLQKICHQLRNIIMKLHPDFFEVVWEKQNIASYGVGPKKMSEHYVYIAPQKKHVNLGFYHGSSLSDKKGILEGTGKSLRHIKLFNETETEDQKIEDYISEAIIDIKNSLK